MLLHEAPDYLVVKTGKPRRVLYQMALQRDPGSSR